MGSFKSFSNCIFLLTFLNENVSRVKVQNVVYLQKQHAAIKYFVHLFDNLVLKINYYNINDK